MKRRKITMMRKIMGIIPVVFTLVIISTAAKAQKVHSFTVQQAIDYAKQNSVHVKNALLDILIQKQVNRDVTSIALPQVNGAMSVTKNINIPVQVVPDFISPATYKVLVDEGVRDGNGQPINYPAGGFGNLPFQFGTPWNANAGVTLSQIVFDGQVFIALKARNGTISLQEKLLHLLKRILKQMCTKCITSWWPVRSRYNCWMPISAAWIN
ncbi:MAG: hypothetical protein IPL50_11085 [Chitinophagaceae bacterium]|nr:hypothetical protein [Chitinophagaceae bacterium]